MRLPPFLMNIFLRYSSVSNVVCNCKILLAIDKIGGKNTEIGQVQVALHVSGPAQNLVSSKNSRCINV